MRRWNTLGAGLLALRHHLRDVASALAIRAQPDRVAAQWTKANSEAVASLCDRYGRRALTARAMVVRLQVRAVLDDCDDPEELPAVSTSFPIGGNHRDPPFRTNEARSAKTSNNSTGSIVKERCRSNSPHRALIILDGVGSGGHLPASRWRSSTTSPTSTGIYGPGQACDTRWSGLVVAGSADRGR